MKAVWALLLLFLSQADTYIGRHSDPDLGLIKADSRQGYYSTYMYHVIANFGSIAGRVKLRDVLRSFKDSASEFVDCWGSTLEE